MKLPGLAMAAVAAALAVAAAQPPASLSQVAGGLWEISGLPGHEAPVRQCVADTKTLVQFEHRGRACSQTLLSSGHGSAKVDYSCGAAGFGRTEVDILTPRSLTIRTQGISDQMPFSYVLQAHRISDCSESASSARH